MEHKTKTSTKNMKHCNKNTHKREHKQNHSKNMKHCRQIDPENKNARKQDNIKN